MLTWTKAFATAAEFKASASRATYSIARLLMTKQTKRFRALAAAAMAKASMMGSIAKNVGAPVGLPFNSIGVVCMQKIERDVIVRVYEDPDKAQNALNNLVNIGWSIISTSTCSAGPFSYKLTVICDRVRPF